MSDYSVDPLWKRIMAKMVRATVTEQELMEAQKLVMQSIGRPLTEKEIAIVERVLNGLELAHQTQVAASLRNKFNRCADVRSLLSGLDGSLKKMVMSYLEAALWSSTDNTADNGGSPLDKHYNFDHFDDASIQKAIADCKAFQEKAEALLGDDDKQFDQELLGHNFWLNRNGHGSGFWDSEDVYGKDLAKKLSDLATSFGSCDAVIYWGKDDAVIQLA
jgi:hypothetical protein